jgi:hypothetical protein
LLSARFVVNGVASLLSANGGKIRRPIHLFGTACLGQSVYRQADRIKKMLWEADLRQSKFASSNGQ